MSETLKSRSFESLKNPKEGYFEKVKLATTLARETFSSWQEKIKDLSEESKERALNILSFFKKKTIVAVALFSFGIGGPDLVAQNLDYCNCNEQDYLEVKQAIDNVKKYIEGDYLNYIMKSYSSNSDYAFSIYMQRVFNSNNSRIFVSSDSVEFINFKNNRSTKNNQYISGAVGYYHKNKRPEIQVDASQYNIPLDNIIYHELGHGLFKANGFSTKETFFLSKMIDKYIPRESTEWSVSYKETTAYAFEVYMALRDKKITKSGELVTVKELRDLMKATVGLETIQTFAQVTKITDLFDLSNIINFMYVDSNYSVSDKD